MIYATPPTVSITGPQRRAYSPAETITVAFTAGDATSGLDWADASLDGLPVSDGQVIPLRDLDLGAHELWVLADDVAGNRTEASVVFTVTIDAGGLCALLGQYAAAGGITHPLSARRMQSLCSGASALLQAADFTAADRALAALIASVLRGATLGFVAPEAAARRTAAAQALLDQLLDAQW